MNRDKPITAMRRFLSMLSPDRKTIIQIYLIAILYGVVYLSLPLGIQAIINLIGGAQVSTSWVVLIVIVILGVAFTGLLQIIQLYMSESIQQKIFARSAIEFAFRLPRIKMESVDRSYVPELVNRFFDTLTVQKGLSKLLIDFSSASLQILFGLLLLSFYHPFFILFSLLLVLLFYLIFRFTGEMGLSTSLEESKHKYEVAYWLEEVGRAMETFKLGGGTPLPMEKTDEHVTDYLGARKKHFRVLVLQYALMIGFKVVITASLLVLGGVLVFNQQMNIGQFVAAEIIILLILTSVEKLILSLETIYDVLTALEKIGAITDLPLEKYTGVMPSASDGGGVEVEIRDLSYRFPGDVHDVLRRVDLHVKPRERVCLVGSDGAGKSTLLHLIAGLYEGYDGQIFVNHTPMANLCQTNYRSIIGNHLVHGDIFAGNVFENIAIGRPDIDRDSMRAIGRRIGLDVFTDTLPHGYETVLQPGGHGLPRSAVLKIMLARCVAGDPQLILLEGSFNRLQPKDRSELLDILLDPERTWTVLAVSNVAEVAERFDRVVGLNAGAVAAMGDLDEVRRHPDIRPIFE